MTTISSPAAHAAALGVKTVHVTDNPLRHGPVVLATDGSSATGASVVAAELLAERLRLPLSIVSVLEPLPTFALSADVVVTIDPAVDDRRIRERETAVTDYITRFAGGAAPAPVHVRVGGVATEIARFAEEMSATVIVMGSSPRRRFNHTTSGELAMHVLHHAPCPVLSVPPTFTALPRTVVVATDFGPSSVRAAQAAMLLVAEGGTVMLTHVMPPAVQPVWLRLVSDEDLAVNMHALFDLMREEMGACVPDGINVETRMVAASDTIDGILSTASLGAEAISIGTHGAGAIRRAFVGSVTDSVLRRATQAVLVSPPPAA